VKGFDRRLCGRTDFTFL